MKKIPIPPVVIRFVAKNWKYLLELTLGYVIPAIFRKKKKDETEATSKTNLQPLVKARFEKAFSNATKKKKWRRNYSRRIHKNRVPDHAFRFIYKPVIVDKTNFLPFILT